MTLPQKIDKNMETYVEWMNDLNFIFRFAIQFSSMSNCHLIYAQGYFDGKSYQSVAAATWTTTTNMVMGIPLTSHFSLVNKE